MNVGESGGKRVIVMKNGVDCGRHSARWTTRVSGGLWHGLTRTDTDKHGRSMTGNCPAPPRRAGGCVPVL